MTFGQTKREPCIEVRHVIAEEREGKKRLSKQRVVSVFCSVKQSCGYEVDLFQEEA